MKRLVLISFLCFAPSQVPAQGLTIPSAHYGLSFGNSPRFNGIRLNFRDKDVEEINGINITLWHPDHNDEAKYRGLMLNLVGNAGGTFTGVSVSGLGHGAGRIHGISFALLGMGADSMKGLFVAGLGVGGDDLEGIFITGLGEGGDRLRGFHASGGHIRARESLTGFGLSAYNRVGRQSGITVGLVNIAGELHGIQLGLINYAGNNPSGTRLLPILNAHF